MSNKNKKARRAGLFVLSGWGAGIRTAAKVAEILDSLGYELAMGRDVVDAESRMGLPDDATLSRLFETPPSRIPQNGGNRDAMR
ncbi:hypothetical protein ABKT97_22215, partial [Enterobacter hormaechei]